MNRFIDLLLFQLSAIIMPSNIMEIIDLPNKKNYSVLSEIRKSV